MKTLIIGCLLTFAVIGCNHDKAPDIAPSATPAAATPPAASVAPLDTSVASATPAPDPNAVAAAAPAGTTAAVPTEEDFEAKAATAISTSNASTELAQLEKEMGK